MAKMNRFGNQSKTSSLPAARKVAINITCDTPTRDVLIGEREEGASRPPNVFEIARKLVKKLVMLRESCPQCFQSPCFSNSSWSNGQNAPPPSLPPFAHL